MRVSKHVWRRSYDRRCSLELLLVLTCYSIQFKIFSNKINHLRINFIKLNLINPVKLKLKLYTCLKHKMPVIIEQILRLTINLLYFNYKNSD